MQDNIETEINSILLKNWNILKKAFDSGKRELHMSDLDKLGFDFNYQTNQMKNQDNEQLFEFTFEYGIGKAKNGYCEIIKLPF